MLMLRAKHLLLCLLLVIGFAIHAYEAPETSAVNSRRLIAKQPVDAASPGAFIISAPWLTGPLLAPAGMTIPKGHSNYEPYLFVTDTFGYYGSHWRAHSVPDTETINPIMIYTLGLTDFMDFQTSIPYLFNTKEGETYNGFGDINMLFGFQAIRSKKWFDLRMTLGETFPSGRYNHLSANRAGTDALGGGSYQTIINANFQRGFVFSSGRVLRLRLSLAYNMPTDVAVNGFNSYGGGFDTVGVVHVGDKYSADFGAEYTLTQHWVPAIDVVYAYGNPVTFSGTVGTKLDHTAASIGMQADELISVAPALEYNFSPALGIIAGAWFTVKGRDASEFASAVIAVNYYH